MNRLNHKSKKIKIKGGLRVRMTLSLFMVFAIFGMMTAFLLKQRMEKNFNNEVRGDMIRIWQNTNIYTMQLMVANHCNNDTDGFLEVWNSLEIGIKTERTEFLNAYDIYGKHIAGNIGTDMQDDYFPKDKNTYLMQRAAEGHSGLIIYKSGNDLCKVRYIFPIYVSEKIPGIISIDTDYSDLIKENNYIVNSSLELMFAAFAVIFIITWIVISRFLAPVISLSDYSHKLTESIGTQHDSGLPKPAASMLRRKDEIGLIAKDYNKVSETIDIQFDRINELIEDKQRFYNNVTHEFKTPLTAIMGYVQLILQDNNNDKELLENGMEHIMAESNRLYRMVLQLLEFSKIKQYEPKQRIILSDCMMNAVASLQLRINEQKRDIIVENMYGGYIMGNAVQLETLYINLIDNAIKYGNEKTPIIISVKSENGFLVSRVVSIGKIIPDEEKEKIFEPFYRVDKSFSRKHGSAGLGLSICRQIAEYHNGDIHVESTKDGINSFIMKFPEAED